MSDISKYVDLESALARVRGNKMLYGKMLGMFLASAEFAAFDKQMTEKDYAKAGETAHGIKGLTGNLGFTKLFETSNALMLQLREGSYDENLLAEYYEALEKTREIVNELIPQMK